MPKKRTPKKTAKAKTVTSNRVTKTEKVRPSCPSKMNLDELNTLKSKAVVLAALCCAEGEAVDDKGLPCTPLAAALAKNLGVPRAALSGALDKLVRNGFAVAKDGGFAITKAGQARGEQKAEKSRHGGGACVR